MIVWVASYPRSGNSFVMSLLWHVFGYRTSSVIAEESNKDLAGLGQAYGYDRLSYEKLARWTMDFRPHFIKTHAPCTDRFPALHIVRDGRDVLVSAAHFNIAIGYTHITDFETELRRLVLDRRYSWSRRVLWWAQKRARLGPTVTIKYEDLQEHPTELLVGALCMIGFQPRVIGKPANFDDLRALDSRQFRRGQTGAWHDEMSLEIQGLFWQEHGEAMRALGYSVF